MNAPMNAAEELRAFLADNWDRLDLDTVERNYSYSLPQAALKFGSHSQVRNALEAAGSHFYDREAIRAFSAKTSDPHLSAGRYWIESVRDIYSNQPREYRVSWVSEYVNGDHRSLSVERLASVPTLSAARALRSRLAKLVTAAEESE